MSPKKKLIEVCHKVYAKGFVTAYDGNISCRTFNNTILITRSGICKGDVSEKDIVEIAELLPPFFLIFANFLH